jgi:hypothetical protein
MSCQPRFATAFWLTSETLIPTIKATVKGEQTSGFSNSVFFGEFIVEMGRVRVHRQKREPDIVGIGDGSPGLCS